MVGISTQAKQFIVTATDNESLLHPETTVLHLNETLEMLNDGRRLWEENKEETFAEGKSISKRDDGPSSKN